VALGWSVPIQTTLLLAIRYSFPTRENPTPARGSVPYPATQLVLATRPTVLKRWKIMTAEDTATLSAPLHSPATLTDHSIMLSAIPRFLQTSMLRKTLPSAIWLSRTMTQLETARRSSTRPSALRRCSQTLTAIQTTPLAFTHSASTLLAF